ncbi:MULTISPECIES: methyltransferase domain-containing protein [Bradyrhizobium]|uniref:SAM-dependent methyltransferase n=1 Tax=Bradyrhizobium ottawaense TaxID=931866 RepID=A0ABV4G195_9BRAD|nr:MULTISPECIES: methyltransferase domain-containing protein [Bradyrhizobium]MBR1293809.1 methyltransferase domain-containing protein [Bradyrhizobium ottawaense]PDT68169.1 SAM-dependent methyltransferase [Bradyrhizobium ottawaense]WLB49076.1 methyltransferase domain-containing protein [Bradyrhizobium ottawaense]WQN79178.1 methyltransferase domain-containing protein [Bradyrhizobium ottawaense]
MSEFDVASSPIGGIKGRLRPYVWSLRSGLRTIRFLFGRFERTCPVCEYRGRFFAYANPLALGINFDSLCPNCLSHERHRLLVLCDAEQGLFMGKDILHFAPEKGLTEYIKARKPRSYVTCEFGGKGADFDINIEKIDLESDRFDRIICCHILEHVNDRLAIPELFRILRKGGTLIAMIPLIEGWQETFEDRSRQKTEEDRILYFNQHDHVRFFGRDFRRRLERAGFVVDEYTAVEPQVAQYGLIRGEKVFLCRKT